MDTSGTSLATVDQPTTNNEGKRLEGLNSNLSISEHIANNLVDTKAGMITKRDSNKFLKIMNGKYAGGFYGRILFDASRGFSFIEFMIEYPDGNRVSVIINKNVCIESNIEGEGITKVKRQVVTGNISKTKAVDLLPNMMEGYNYGDYEAFKKYERVDMPIPMEVLWEEIINKYNRLPMKVINSSPTLNDLYDIIEAFGDRKDSIYRDDLGYYFNRDEMIEICEQANTNIIVIRQLLDSRGLLDKDNNSKGYTKSKKINGKKENLYHIRYRQNSDIEMIQEECKDYTDKPTRTLEKTVIGGFGYIKW